MKPHPICSILTLLVCVSPVLRGGEQTNVRALGMARTFVASSRNLDAVGINPAGLYAPEDATVTFSLLPLGVNVGSDFLSYGMYNDLFTGVDGPGGRVAKNLTDSDKQRLLDAFPGGLGRLGGEAEVRSFGLALHIGGLATVSATVTDRISADAQIPSSYARLLLYGMSPNSTSDLSGTRGAAAWMREYALSGALPVPTFGLVEHLTAGLSLKLMHGYAYEELSRNNSLLSTGVNGVLDGSVDLAGVESVTPKPAPFPLPAGTGIGVDVGFTAQLNDYMTAGLSVTDIGSINWNTGVKEFYGQGSIHLDDVLNSAQRDSLQHALTGRTRDGKAFTTALPTALRLGVAFDLQNLHWIKKVLMGDLLVECDYNQGFNNFPGSTTIGRFSIGTEYKPWSFIPLRTGVSFGGLDRFNFALGFGLHLGLFQLDVGSDNMGWLFSHDSFTHGSVGLSMMFRF